MDGAEGSGGCCLQLKETLLKARRQLCEEAEQFWDQPDLNTGPRDQRGHGGGSDAAGLGGELAHAVLVGAQPCLVVAAGLGQFLRQDIGADHGDAGAAANSRAWRVAGVADQGDPALDPAIHHDLADRVEVEVLSGVHLRQQPGNLPPILSIDAVQHLLLAVDVAVIEPQLLAAAKQETSPGRRSLVDGVDRREPAGRVPDHHPAIKAEVIGQGDPRQIAAEESAEPVFGPEDQPADDRVEAVRSDDNVEPVGGGVLERHGDALGLFDDRLDRILEQVLRVTSCRPEMPATRRRISTSTPRPSWRWNETISVRVRASITAGSTPVHSATSIAGPNRSTACPLVRTRTSGIRSTTVTVNPRRQSQYAAVGPATLAPEIRTRKGSLVMSPTHVSGQCARSSLMFAAPNPDLAQEIGQAA